MEVHLAIFDSREWANLIWLGIALSLLLLFRRTRKPTITLITAVLQPVIAIPMLLLASWTAGLVLAGYRLSWWNSQLLGDTLIWFFGVALVLLFNANKALAKERFFRRTILSAVGVAVFIEVFINLYVFSIWGELILVAGITVLTMLSVVAGTQERFKRVKALIDWALAVAGFILIIYVIFQIVRNWEGFDRPGAVRELWLPIWLTLGVVPFVYFFSIYIGYDSAFRWINFGTEDRRSRWRAKVVLVLKLHGRTRDLGAFNMPWGKRLGDTSSLREARQVVEEFRVETRERRLAPIRERERLERFAGVKGVDEDGRQLDQREFKETRRALQTLASAQMGWYRNRGERYRKKLLEILKPQFEADGLPSDHGITLRVAKDRKSWWAWRRTVTGWCLGVGAVGPPPDEWLYDGPEPPSGPPGEGSDGWSQWGGDARNW
jgi:hypothetical protein